MLCLECDIELKNKANNCSNCGYSFKTTERVVFIDSKKTINKNFI